MPTPNGPTPTNAEATGPGAGGRRSGDDPGERTPLSPDRIIRTALGIVTRDGPEALTMRRVASALHVEPMSLYHHVPSKKALLDGVAGMALEAVGTFHDLAGSWDEQIKEAARRLRRVMLDNPKAVTLVATRPMHSEQIAELVESGLARLTDLGFSIDDAADVLWTISDFVIGNVLNRIGALGGTDLSLPAPEDRRRIDATFTADRFPNLMVVFTADARSDDEETARFERSLDVLVAGFATRYDTPA